MLGRQEDGQQDQVLVCRGQVGGEDERAACIPDLQGGTRREQRPEGLDQGQQGGHQGHRVRERHGVGKDRPQHCEPRLPIDLQAESYQLPLAHPHDGHGGSGEVAEGQGVIKGPLDCSQEQPKVADAGLQREALAAGAVQPA